MFSAINTAASGLFAAEAKLNVSASNVANADSEGYTARRVELVERSPAGSGVRAGEVVDTGRPVDLEQEAVEQVRARQLYTANAVVLKVADSLVGTVLDVVSGGRRTERGRR